MMIVYGKGNLTISRVVPKETLGFTKCVVKFTLTRHLSLLDKSGDLCHDDD